MIPLAMIIGGTAVMSGSTALAGALGAWSWTQVEDPAGVKQIMRDQGFGSLADNLPG